MDCFQHSVVVRCQSSTWLPSLSVLILSCLGQENLLLTWFWTSLPLTCPFLYFAWRINLHMFLQFRCRSVHSMLFVTLSMWSVTSVLVHLNSWVYVSYIYLLLDSCISLSVFTRFFIYFFIFFLIAFLWKPSWFCFF